MKKPKSHSAVDLPGEDETMTTVEVARFAHISYQTAYNRVLAGVYGASEYSAKTRTMTVNARYVHRVVAREKKRAKKSA